MFLSLYTLCEFLDEFILLKFPADQSCVMDLAEGSPSHIYAHYNHHLKTGVGVLCALILKIQYKNPAK